jgi:hypothetical protein
VNPPCNCAASGRDSSILCCCTPGERKLYADLVAERAAHEQTREVLAERPAERMYTRAEMLAFGARVLDDRHEFEHFACESDPMNWHGLKPCTRGCVAKHVAVLLDAPVRPQTDEPMFYIQNKGNGGDLVLWWRPERRGYTVCIDQAGLYSQKEAEEIVRNRPPEDIMHAQYDIDTIVGRVIFHETLRRVLREKESAR